MRSIRTPPTGALHSQPTSRGRIYGLFFNTQPGEEDIIDYLNRTITAPTPQSEALPGREDEMVGNSAGGMVFAR